MDNEDNEASNEKKRRKGRIRSDRRDWMKNTRMELKIRHVCLSFLVFAFEMRTPRMYF